MGYFLVMLLFDCLCPPAMHHKGLLHFVCVLWSDACIASWFADCCVPTVPLQYAGQCHYLPGVLQSCGEWYALYSFYCRARFVSALFVPGAECCACSSVCQVRCH